ncbi:DUF5675 family protein [Hahella ganghwensis]|uniref:DUF5675 family protein n=1 Tax=Hahella ganghwensis TaxID=286420 RepID=UPI00037DA4B5|nr:DUF5675 family protein [Hahella ganghwensis]
MQVITLERFAYATDGTFGRLQLPNDRILYTCERPWLNNQTGKSCIPDGLYKLQKRDSGVVRRSSGGDYISGWEVTDVPGRTYIMIHPANWPHQLEGCIAPGMNYQIISGKNAVTQSRLAFSVLMGALDGFEDLYLQIKPYSMVWP